MFFFLQVNAEYSGVRDLVRGVKVVFTYLFISLLMNLLGNGFASSSRVQC